VRPVSVDRWLGGGTALAGLVLIGATRDLRGLPQSPVGPDLVPALVGLGLMATGGALILSGTRRASARVEHNGHAVAPTAWVFAGALVWTLLLEPLGFLVVTPLLLAGLLWTLDRRPGRALALGLGMTCAVHMVVAGGLGVPLPWGVLAPVAGMLPWM